MNAENTALGTLLLIAAYSVIITIAFFYKNAVVLTLEDKLKDAQNDLKQTSILANELLEKERENEKHSDEEL